jgi:hypothetical protein
MIHLKFNGNFRCHVKKCGNESVRIEVYEAFLCFGISQLKILFTQFYNLKSHQNNENDRTNQSFTSLGSVSLAREKRNHTSKKQMSFFS